MFCGNCGKEVNDTSLFCQSCGAKVGGEGEAVQMGWQQAPAPVQQAYPVQQQASAGTVVAPVPLASDEKYCFSCGSGIKKAAEICPRCGVNQSNRAGIQATDVFCSSCGRTIKKMAEICPLCGVDQTKRAAIQAVDLYCLACGKSVKKVADVCPHCGVRQRETADGYPPGYAPKSWVAALLLLIFLGGVHRLYVGKIGSGILYPLLVIIGYAAAVPTFGISTLPAIIWFIVDLVNICRGKFTDGKGYPLKRG